MPVRPSRLGRFLTGGLVLLAVAPAGADARPAGVEPIPGARLPYVSEESAVARVDARGGVVFAYQDNAGVQLVSRRAGGRFTRVRRLDDLRGDDTEIAVAVAPDGSAIVAWTRNDHSLPADPDARDEDCCVRIRAVVVRPDGRLARRPRTLSPRGVDAGRPAVAAARGGRYAVAWQGRHWTLRRAGAGGRFRRAARVGRGSSVALAYVGRRLVALGERFGRGERAVLVQRRFPGRARVVSAPFDADGQLPAAVVTAGRGTVVALEPDYLPEDRTSVAIQRRPGTRFRLRRVGSLAGLGAPRAGRVPLVLEGRPGRAAVRVLRPGRSTRLGRRVTVRRSARRSAVAPLTLTPRGRVVGLELTSQRRATRVRLRLVREGHAPRRIGVVRGRWFVSADAGVPGLATTPGDRLSAIFAVAEAPARLITAAP